MATNEIFFKTIFTAIDLISSCFLCDKPCFLAHFKLDFDMKVKRSFLLLEIDTDPLIEEKIQNKVLPIKKLLKSNGINYQNFSVTNKEITFKISDNNYKKCKRQIEVPKI